MVGLRVKMKHFKVIMIVSIILATVLVALIVLDDLGLDGVWREPAPPEAAPQTVASAQ